MKTETHCNFKKIYDCQKHAIVARYSHWFSDKRCIQKWSNDCEKISYTNYACHWTI